MKIRTDFVTNSSSSSFVAMLEARLDDGKKLTALYETSQGEGSVISAGPYKYEMEEQQIHSIDKLKEYDIEIAGQFRQIVSGSLHLMCHTEGEYIFEADPRRMISRYLDYRLDKLIEQIDTSINEKRQFQQLRSSDILESYTDNAIWELIRLAYDQDTEQYSDAEIIQTLRQDGTIDLKIDIGEDLFDLEDPFDFDSWDDTRHQRKSKLILGGNRKKRLQKELKEKAQLEKELQKAQREEERKKRAEAKLIEAQNAEKRREEQKARKEQNERMRIAEAEERQRQKEEELQRKAAAEVAKQEHLQKAAAERERQIREGVLYRPGEEPANIRKRIDILFPKLDAAYPDRRISGLNKDHKKWGETVTELYRALGYPDSRAFLEAYGYTIVENKGGRPATTDPRAAIEQLCERYPDGAGDVNMDKLKADNPDIPWKTLANNAREYFGCTLSLYLKKIGIIGTGKVQRPEAAVAKHEEIKSVTVDSVSAINTPISSSDAMQERVFDPDAIIGETVQTNGSEAADASKRTDTLLKNSTRECYRQYLKRLGYSEEEINFKEMAVDTAEVYATSRFGEEYKLFATEEYESAHRTIRRLSSSNKFIALNENNQGKYLDAVKLYVEMLRKS